MLPNCLKYKTKARANEEYVIQRLNCRFTIITSRLIRMEYCDFTDAATLTVISRSFAEPEFSATEENGILIIKTEYLELTYTIGKEFSADTLSIKLLNKPYNVWHYGEKPLNNLGGTVTTLDMVNGACEISDGVCSIDGYALIDDSTTPLFDYNGWFLRRNDNTTDIYFFGYGHDYTECIKDYYCLTGTPEMLPAFALGNCWCVLSNIQVS